MFHSFIEEEILMVMDINFVSIVIIANVIIANKKINNK